MSRHQRIGVALLGLAMFASGCYGPFNLTRRVHQWNGQVGDKWVQEIVFIVLVWAPVYGLSTLGDAVIFNTIEFWGGKNPVAPPGMTRNGEPQTKRLARGNSEAVLTYTPGSGHGQFLIEQFQQGHPTDSLRIEQRDGATVGVDADNRVLFTAQTLPDGSLMIQDATGQTLATYSAHQVDRMLAKANRQ